MIINIDSISAPELKVYTNLTDGALRHTDGGLFIAESPKVITTALNAGYSPVSLLTENRHIQGDAAAIIERVGDIPIYTGSRETLTSLTGYTLTRGVLCAMRRRPLPDPEIICSEASRVVVIDDVCDTTNIGAIFRSTAALGFDAILLTPTSCDPLNRRSIRVSMGTVFQIPWTRLATGDQSHISYLSRLGFKTVAMALTDKSVSLDDPTLNSESQLAIIMGAEGYGLKPEIIAATDYTVCIPMAHGVDSLNVAAATAVACWQLRKK